MYKVETIMIFENECPINFTHSIREAYTMLKTYKEEDKKRKTKNNYVCKLIEESENSIFYSKVKLYKRNETYFMKKVNI